MSLDNLKIESRDYWFKVVDFLQQNWALIEQTDIDKFTVYFFGDTSGIFDEIEFGSLLSAEKGLQRNGFRRYKDDIESQKFIACPNPLFHRREHPNGKIYSSGRFWV